MFYTEAAIETFVQGYLRAAVWSSTDDDGNPLDANWDASEFGHLSIDVATAECRQFIGDNWQVLGEYIKDTPGEYSAMESAGYNFWLSRNHHGSGFLDRDDAAARQLDEVCSRMQERYVHVNGTHLIITS